jgi:hypothetical protein
MNARNRKRFATKLRKLADIVEQGIVEVDEATISTELESSVIPDEYVMRRQFTGWQTTTVTLRTHHSKPTKKGGRK